MNRKLVPIALLAILLAPGCGGPAKLAEHSEEKLAAGKSWQAWKLATKALDKAPGNVRAKAAADAAARTIAADWQRRILALGSVDSLGAAEQVMEFVSFRADAARYTTVQVDSGWTRAEQTLRQGAAHSHYQSGTADLRSRRPKSAYRQLLEAERFWPGYRDASALADRALQQGQTRVAIVPLRVAAGAAGLGREVAASWRGEIVGRMSPPGSQFTRILPVEDVEGAMRVGDLGRLTRDDAIRLGRQVTADRIVWGSIGEPDSKSSLQVFSDTVARRIVEKDAAGHSTERWVEVPIEVIARVRTVNVNFEYEVISTRDGSTLARRGDTRTMKARVVWTAYTPEASPETYALVSEQMRAANPDRARQVETKWRAVLGEGTTLVQVLDAKRSISHQPIERGEALGRLMAGAAFVMLEDLPSTEELTLGALAGGWDPIHQDLLRLDGVDDVDLGVTTARPTDR